MLKLELETQTRNKSGEGKALTGKYTHYGYYSELGFQCDFLGNSHTARMLQKAIKC